MWLILPALAVVALIAVVAKKHEPAPLIVIRQAPPAVALSTPAATGAPFTAYWRGPDEASLINSGRGRSLTPFASRDEALTYLQHQANLAKPGRDGTKVLWASVTDRAGADVWGPMSLYGGGGSS